MRETGYNGYQKKVTNKIRDMFPGCLILRNDPAHLQGIPDFLILYNERWAALEIKGSKKANIQPNQPYYVELLGEMSFAAFLYPENEEAVLHDLQLALTSQG